MDDADASDKRIADVVEDAINRAKHLADAPSSIKPVTHWNGEETVGLCLYCRCEIQQGAMFCRPDEVEPSESCHIRYHHEQKRKRETGRK